MRIQYLSDLHFEHHADAGASFVASMAPRGVDVLVIAGDLAPGPAIGPALDLFCARYGKATVVYVHGNHEHYGFARREVALVTQGACARHENLRWLDGNVVEIGGQRILGAPLWFERPSDESLKAHMEDFSRIPDFERWVYAENARATAFFRRELRAGDVVVTHHLPVRASIARRWRRSRLNAFFLCDVEALIRERSPAVWIHGHTHSTVDIEVSTQRGTTRVVSNPFGYVGHDLNRDFEDAAVLDL